jgi:hypothetical protein
LGLVDAELGGPSLIEESTRALSAPELTTAASEPAPISSPSLAQAPVPQPASSAEAEPDRVGVQG